MPLEPIASHEGPFGDAQRFHLAAATTHEEARGLARSLCTERLRVAVNRPRVRARGTHGVARVLSRKLKTVPARAGAFRYE